MHGQFRVADLIEKKRNRKDLTTEEIRFFIRELVEGGIEGCQLGAMLMAWYLHGMSSKELATLVDSMIHSGETLQWPEEWIPILVDKHSTGGVGDKVSLVLAPALAACGLKVPMVSGRGLGFTGGTLDKLESIPGFNVNLDNDQMIRCLKTAGCFIAGQTKSLVPADRIMYAARDVTATVDNINLATASIISKKAAENISALVLDVKVGRAAFFKSLDSARQVAKSLVETARSQNIKTAAVLSTMDTPIGRAVGNTLEINEVVETLRGQGVADLTNLIEVQGGLLLWSVGKADSAEKGEEMIRRVLNNGTALMCFEQMLVQQEVDPQLAADLCSGVPVLPQAKYVSQIRAPCTGYVIDIDALAIGVVCGTLGAGRARTIDGILPAVGLELLVHLGQHVTEGEPWAELHHECPEVPAPLWANLHNSIVVGPAQPDMTNSTNRILEVIL